MLFPHVVYKSSLLFTLALQSKPAFSHSLPSPFVIITSDTLADAIGSKAPRPPGCLCAVYKSASDYIDLLIDQNTGLYTLLDTLHIKQSN